MSRHIESVHDCHEGFDKEENFESQISEGKVKEKNIECQHCDSVLISNLMSIINLEVRIP